MTLTDLRYIVALSQERHFGRAAEKCHVSQPTLSIAVKKLEDQLGVTLFERSAADVQVTEIGRQIVAQAENVLREAHQVRDIAEAGKDPLAGPLRLGVIYTIGPYLLPALIPLLAARAPRMPLVIQENYTARLAEALKRGEIDVAIVALPFEESGIVAQPIYDEPFRVVLPAAHAWAEAKHISAQRLQEEPLLLLGTGNCFRDQVLAACPSCAHGTGLQKTLEGSSLETIRHMVATGLGITVLPSTAADPLVESQKLVAIRHFSTPEPSRRVALAWRVTYPRTKVIDLLRNAIFDSHLPGVANLRSTQELALQR
ncbi:MAG: LysR family transcriptional regulator [Rhodocyclales bacterium]|nr:LysR family transcriptional regulator [Rhodocyclales bacterium]